MQCPACHRELESKTVGGVTVDVCSDGCGGIWFDQGELSKFDEPSESAGEELLDIPLSLGVKVDQSKRYRCTKCPDSVLMRHFFSAKQAVVVDECPTCAGYWLDPGELRRIRSEYSSEAARHEAAEAYFREVLGPKLEARRAENAEHLARAQRIANMFKFICPSWYIPGKQKGGAF
jgi:Zn-finger nucleic acid-binding protein